MTFFRLNFTSSLYKPVAVLALILLSLVAKYLLNSNSASSITLVLAITIGCYSLVLNTLDSLLKRHFALDYIAILAVTAAIVDSNFLVAAIIALMLSSGSALEDIAEKLAKKSLSLLSNRIPSTATLWERGQPSNTLPLSQIVLGANIVIRKGEIIPLDGLLTCAFAFLDESSLTGEVVPVEKKRGNIIRSGTLNVGDIITLKVTKTDQNSTYKKIINLVEQAQTHKPPLIRLTDKFSLLFTFITIAIGFTTYAATGDFHKLLAILVVATPCPLLIAAPIALMGGLNSAAKKNIVLKNLSSLEILSRVDTLIFDKTGTITLGHPKVISVEVSDHSYSHQQTVSIATALEENSLHPLAKAIVDYSKKIKAPDLNAEAVKEVLGKGITGTVDGRPYTISKSATNNQMSTDLLTNKHKVATFYFQDEVKKSAGKVLNSLIKQGLKLEILTGDKLDVAKKLLDKLKLSINIHAQCTPQEKKDAITLHKHLGHTVAMVGDGINDAPALAFADVGLVFSHQENTAASEAADVVFLGGDLNSINTILKISSTTINITLQSIYIGIGLSIFLMILAAFGYIPPLMGAFLQELLDVAVIINSLRASRIT